ncbi:RimK family alpha-L-glutamate ligase [Streptomyces sp. NPDC127069]|uniref:ATP-grasp domain-containing protein n=1 Tax=Streptomyces sp. NPDC127069 TaxID=3347128 RepID=UPI0036654BEE
MDAVLVLAPAVEELTGRQPIRLDARGFFSGAGGRIRRHGDRVRLTDPAGRAVEAGTVLVYQIDPADVRRFSRAQGTLAAAGVAPLAGDRMVWRNAIEKDRTVRCFARAGVPHPQTVALRRPSLRYARTAFTRLGGDVWTKPTVGERGQLVRHVTSLAQLRDAVDGYAAAGQDWLMSRDAGNWHPRGGRQCYRITVLDGRPLYAADHRQTDTDRPTNEAAGAHSVVVPLDQVPDRAVSAAVAATSAVGLRFGGVDVAVTANGFTVFEVNVHPGLQLTNHYQPVAIPWVRAQLRTP